MSTPKTEPSTKKAFNFPKSAAAKSTKSSKSTAKDARPASEKPKKSAPKTASPASKTKSKAVESKVAEQPAQVVEPVAAPAKSSTAKVKNAKKEKVVRDSFTMPRSDYAKLASLKQKCSANGLRVKKSELLRAALTMLDAAPDKRVVAAVKALETVKTGRPANS